MEVQVRGSLDRALRDLNKKLKREGRRVELERHEYYLKPGERRNRKRHQAVARRLQQARWLAMRTASLGK